MKSLAITGLTGQKSGGAFAEIIGDNLDVTRAMFPDGIRAVVRPSSDTGRLTSLIPAIEIFRGIMDDSNFLSDAFEGIDTVIHIAGIHRSVAIVNAAAACHVRRLILVHTTGIYSKYKEAGEEYRRIDSYVRSVCEENHIALTILRPTMIYGNAYDQNMIIFVKLVDKMPLMPIVNGARYDLQPVHYKDLANAYWDVLVHEDETSGREFVLSGKEPIQLREILVIIGNKQGKKVHFINCPYFIAYPGAVVLYWLSFKRVDYREKVQRLCESRAYSHDEAAKAFGFSPRTFFEGIGPEIEQYMSKK